jgi:hypothetical protein
VITAAFRVDASFRVESVARRAHSISLLKSLTLVVLKSLVMITAGKPRTIRRSQRFRHAATPRCVRWELLFYRTV